MKILTLNYEYPPVGGGGATVTAQLCEHLVQLGHSVDVATMRYKNLPYEETIDGVRIFRVRSYRSRADICKTHEMATYMLGGRKQALKLVKQNQYDIIHAHFIVPTSPLAKWLNKKTGIPYIITCHGTDVPGRNPQRFVFMHKLIKPYWKSLAKSPAMLISPTNSLKANILTQCPQANVTIIPNGIDFSAFKPSQKKQTILMCSRLLEFKGFQYVIEAIKELDLGWEAHVVGEGPYRQKLEQLAQDSKIPVTFHGWLDHSDPKFQELYEASSIFVFPSEMENFPTVLLEAMSAGCAIITSTAGGCPEVVGNAGILVEPKNANALREKILYLIENKEIRTDLANRAVQQTRRFAWANVTKKYLNLYQDVISGK